MGAVKNRVKTSICFEDRIKQTHVTERIEAVLIKVLGIAGFLSPQFSQAMCALIEDLTFTGLF